jgi:hypothetical protein
MADGLILSPGEIFAAAYKYFGRDESWLRIVPVP